MKWVKTNSNVCLLFYLTMAKYYIWGLRPSPSIDGWGIILDDYDGQMVSWEECGLNFLEFVLQLRENLGKTSSMLVAWSYKLAYESYERMWSMLIITFHSCSSDAVFWQFLNTVLFKYINSNVIIIIIIKYVNFNHSIHLFISSGESG